MLERPTQIGHERGRFDRFAEISASVVGRIDILAAALADSMTAQDDERLRDSIEELRAVVKLEEQI